MRVIVTGSKDFADYNAVSRALKWCWRFNHELVVVHSASCKGVDVLAQEVVNDNWYNHVTADPMPVRWRELGKDAPRDQVISVLDLGADHIFAFYTPGDHRSTLMHRMALERGFRVREGTPFSG